MNFNNYKISVVTVCFNSEKTIAETINSVINQDYTNLEYIIVDGKSTDRTLEIINQYRDKINVIISEKDLGLYDAINKGIKIATGDIVGILNSDDLFNGNNVLSKINNSFNLRDDIEIIFSDVIFFDDVKKKTVRYYSSKYFKPFLFRYGFQPAHPTFYAKKYLFDKIGNYDIKYTIASDFDLMSRFLYIHKIKYLYIKDVWVKMLIGGVSTSGIKSVIKINSEIIDSCKKNRIHTNIILIYSKYLFKWFSFFKINRNEY
jgi:glycosyltransferase involved in cell wall biosynthesis